MGLPISGTTKLLGLVASPAKHSMSPAMHNASFKKLDVDARYLAFDVAPDDLQSVVKGMAKMGVVGYNVGVPHKNTILPFLDELTEGAKLMQSVNCVQIVNGRSIGHNTDGLSFTKTLRNAGIDPKGSSICILDIGAEGPAYTVQAALEGAARVLVICDDGECEVTRQRLWRLQAVTPATDIQVLELEEACAIPDLLDGYDVLCNATRIGTGASLGISPLPIESLNPGLTIIETIYTPLETELLRLGEEVGAQIIDGLVPLLNQSAVAEHLWLGIEMPTKHIAKKFF